MKGFSEVIKTRICQNNYCPKMMINVKINCNRFRGFISSILWITACFLHFSGTTASTRQPIFMPNISMEASLRSNNVLFAFSLRKISAKGPFPQNPKFYCINPLETHFNPFLRKKKSMHKNLLYRRQRSSQPNKYELRKFKGKLWLRVQIHKRLF